MLSAESEVFVNYLNVSLKERVNLPIYSNSVGQTKAKKPLSLIFQPLTFAGFFLPIVVFCNSTVVSLSLDG